MKSKQKQLLQNHEFYIRSYPKTSGKSFDAYLQPSDIPARKAKKVLNRLNSFDSAEQLKSTVQQHTKQMSLSDEDMKRILNSKVALGKFQDLRQVAIVRGIGHKKFDLIVRALSN